MRILLSFSLLILTLCSFSQQTLVPLTENHYKIDEEINVSNKYIHTGFKPLYTGYLSEYFNTDSLMYGTNRDSLILSKIKGKTLNWFWRKLRTEDFLFVDTTDFKLAINPLINIFEGKISGIDSDSLYRQNTRGIMVKGNIGKKLAFYSDFFENQAFYPDYVNEYIIKHRVAPGQGRVRIFKQTGYDYSSAQGYLVFEPYKFLNFQAGHYKNFIGEGYRSLLLSDVSYSYPFFKTTLTWKRLQYIYMLSSHQEVSMIDSRSLVYQRKHGSFNYLNFIIHKNIQLGLFEAVMWKTTDSTGNNKFSLNYFNPVLFERVLQYGLNSENNILLGAQAKVKLARSLQAYGQFLLDDFETGIFGKKYGYQAGIKIFSPFKIHNLFIQTEYNFVSPHTYAHNNIRQNYTNANEPLAHPLGSDFKEIFFRLTYNLKDLYFDFKYSYAEVGENSDIFIPDTAVLQTVNNQGFISESYLVKNLTMTLSYLLNPKTDLRLFIKYHRREFINSINKNDMNSISFGISTSLYNYYYDF
ncbi:MAG: hypothetical protein Kow0068_20400 [Marinilabiliales bacterium]